MSEIDRKYDSLLGLADTLETDASGFPEIANAKQRVVTALGGLGIANVSDIPTQAPIPPPPPGADGLITGGNVSWVGLLNFVVSAATYRISGVDLSSAQTSLTLGAADATNPRIDVIAVNSSGAAVVIAGTPAASPSAPSVDPATQIALTFILVAANATTPSSISKVDIYLENTEYTVTQVGTHFTAASTNNPFAGTKDVEASAAVATDAVIFTKPSSTLDLSPYNALVFFIRFKAAWPSAKSLSVSWRNGTTQIGQAVTVKGGLFNLDGNNITGYQQVIIPLSSFNVTSAINKLVMTVVGGGGSIGFYLDNISVQAGVLTSTPLPSNIMLFKGAYSATTAYAIDDVVTSGGATYVAIAPSTNVTPGTDATKWTQIAAAATTAVTDATIATTDVATNNASTTKHGWLIKATAPSAGLRNVVAIDNGETVYKDAALFDATVPAGLGTAAAGSQMAAARRDHVHPATGIVDAIEFVIDGSGSAITTGVKGFIEIPYACTINQVTLLADQSGSIVVDIWKDTYANYPPTNADSIAASAKPTISSATKSQDSTLTGWTTSISAGDILGFNVDSITTCQRVTVSLKVTR